MVASSTSPLRPELAKLVSGRAWRTRRFGAWAALITGAWLVLEFTIVELALFGTPSLAQSSSQDPAVVGTTLGLALVWGVALWTLGRSGASVNGHGLRVVWGWRTRGVSWADVEGFVPNLGGNPGLWLQTAPKTFPLPSPLHQLSPATSEECALRLNQALGIDPAVSRSGTWTGVEVGVVVPPDGTAGSNPRARRPELVANSEIATMLTRRAWDRTGVKVSVFAWCIFWLVSVGWLAGRATFDSADAARPAQLVIVAVAVPFAVAVAWSILRRRSMGDADGIIVIGGIGRRWIPWSDVLRFHSGAPTSGSTAIRLQIYRVGGPPVILPAVPKREAKPVAEQLNLALGLNRSGEPRPGSGDDDAGPAAVPSGMSQWMVRSRPTPVLDPGSEVARLLTGRAWEARLGKYNVAFWGISGFGFVIFMLGLAAFDAHDRSRPAQLVTAAVFGVATVGCLLMILRQRSTVDAHGIRRVQARRTRYLRWSDIDYFAALGANRIGAVLTDGSPAAQRTALPTVFHTVEPSRVASSLALLNDFLGATPPPADSAFQWTAPVRNGSAVAGPWADPRKGSRAEGLPSDPAVRDLLVGNERQSERFWKYTVPGTLAALALAGGLAAAAASARVDDSRTAQVVWAVILTVGAVAGLWLHARSGTTIDERGLDKVVAFTHVRIPWMEVTGFTDRCKDRPGIYVQRNGSKLVRVPNSKSIDLDRASEAVGRLNRACGFTHAHSLSFDQLDVQQSGWAWDRRKEDEKDWS